MCLTESKSGKRKIYKSTACADRGRGAATSTPNTSMDDGSSEGKLSTSRCTRVDEDDQEQVAVLVGVRLRRDEDRNEKNRDQLAAAAAEAAALLRRGLGGVFHKAYMYPSNVDRESVEDTILEVEITACSDDGKERIERRRPWQHFLGSRTGSGRRALALDVRWLLKSDRNGHVFIREKEGHYRDDDASSRGRIRFADIVKFGRNEQEGVLHVDEAMSRIVARATCDIAEAVARDLETIKTLGTERYQELKWTEPPLEGKCLESNASEKKKPAACTSTLSVPTITQDRHRLPVNAEATALLVVDVQPEYWSDCPDVRRDFPEFPGKLRKTIAVCRARGTRIIFVRADYRYSHSPWLVQFARLHEGKSSHTMTEVPCDPDADDFRWEGFATPEGGDVILPKTSWSSSSNGKLTDWLHGAGIDTVLVCGLITSVCVQHSAFSIFEAGFRTLLVTDACADRGRARHDAALALYGDYMYELVATADLEDPERGLIKAEPVWLTLDETKEGDPMIEPQPRPFSKLQEDVVAITGLSRTIVSTV